MREYWLASCRQSTALRLTYTTGQSVVHRRRLTAQGPLSASPARTLHPQPLPAPGPQLRGVQVATVSPPPASENDTSFQCSTCPGGTDLDGGHDPTDSSMAVECDTTHPTISPVSAVRTTRRGSHRPPPRQRISYSSAIATSNAGTWGSSSTLQPSTTHIDHSTPTLWPPRGSSPLLEDVTSDPTQQGRPNTPVTSGSESSRVVACAEGYESHDQEKWV